MWRDSWLLKGHHLSPNVEPTDSQQDERVNLLIDNDRGCWKQDVVRNLFQPQTAEKILSIPLSKRCPKDKLIWTSTSNGKFTVKSAYQLAWNVIFDNVYQEYDNIMKPVWNAIWLMDVPSKIRHTFWRFVWGILPTKDVLQRRGVDLPQQCGICGCTDESYHHTFFDCHWSKEVWAKVCPDFSYNTLNQDSFLDEFLDYFLSLNTERREVVAVTLWSIWNNRNRCVFNDSCLTSERSARLIGRYLEEYKNANSAIPLEADVTGRSSISTSSSWLPPPEGIIKINTDAALPIGQDIAKFGVVLRDSNGAILGAAQKSQLFSGSATHAEIMALDFGLQIGKEFGCSKIIIEIDCMPALKIAESLEECFLPIGAVVADLQAKAQSFFSCIFKYVPRTSNELAHNIASLPVCNPPWEGIWYGSLPRVLCSDSN